MFWCIVLQVIKYPDLVNTSNKFSFHLVDIFHALYNKQFSDKFENVLKYMCWDNAHLIIGLEYQCVGSWNNNVTQISSVVMHIGMVDTYTLSPCPYQLLMHVYDSRAASHIFIYLKQAIGHLPDLLFCAF